jgi:hypothetical protein
MTDDRPYRNLFGAPPPKTGGLLGDLLSENLFSPPPSSEALALANALLGNRLFNAMTDPPPAPPRGLFGLGLGAMTAPPPPPATGLGALAQALASMDQPTGLARFTDPPPTNELTGLGFGLPRPMTDPAPYNIFNPAPVTKPYLPPLNRTPTISNLPDVRRRTFFSFHFPDSFRVNQVRQSWRLRPKSKDPRAPLWFHDSSIWEKSKKTDDEALKQLIREGLERSSVTCVLAGEETWSRPWVRYEIARSVLRRNGLLTVYIHGLECPNTGLGNLGHNPLDFMGVYEKPTGGFYLCEKDHDGQWYAYDKVKVPVAWPRFLPKASGVNIAQPLSAGAKVYDYARDGYTNLSAWVQAAAVAAGK